MVELSKVVGVVGAVKGGGRGRRCQRWWAW